MPKETPPTNIPARYLEALGGEDPLVIQKKAPKRLKKLLKGLSEKELSKKPAPDKWSIKEVIGHLADHEVVYGFRLRCVIALDRPTLTSYDQDRFVERLATATSTTKELFDAYEAARVANHALFESLDSAAFERVGLHTERGEETLRTIVTRNAGHDVLHEQQVERTREAVRAKARKAKKSEKKSAI
ncbi:MAG: DinB family protein [Planctomycetota bacterium]|nr:DinB family protein [Planctomycetota bacterium]